ncbi:Hypothetical predicted protein [Paramuricea clavata]|uniref:C17orf113 probable zinc finger domain-containing protein n=1 Tax=Paramuricea clavata TaxID=317549 RepID=A0A7D9ESW2_PARCT|nr:Hypothetical predicted protein [Paramuricea clavata]
MWKFVVRNPTDKGDNPSASGEVQEFTGSTTSSTSILPTDQGNQRNDAINTEQSERSNAKQKRKFNPLWQKAFPWVRLVNKKMFCDVCTKNKHADKSSAFVKGCDNFHIKSLRKHNTSSGHVKCAANVKALSAEPGTNPAERALRVLHEKEFEKMRDSKNGRPYSDYEWALDLQETTHNIKLGETYRNDRAGRKFTAFIAEAERLKLASELSTTPFYSILTDGTTDTSVCEAEILYVRHCNKGKISNRFLALRNLERANAENITKVIEETVKDFGGVSEEDLYKKAVGYGADGASVNMGCHSGVGERLKQLSSIS